VTEVKGVMAGVKRKHLMKEKENPKHEEKNMLRRKKGE